MRLKPDVYALQWMIFGLSMQSAETGRRSAPATWQWLAIGTVCAVGIAARIKGITLSFWMDEAWVANSLMTDSLSAMFYYERWLQTTPPGFLLLARWLVDVLGVSPISLRLLPEVSGALGVVLVAFLSGRLLPPPFGFLSATMVALSPTAVEYSWMLKQYSGEFLVGALLLVAAWRDSEERSQRTFIVLLAAVVFGLMFAYGSVFCVAGIIAFELNRSLIAQEHAGPDQPRATIRIAMLCVIAAAVLAFEYFVLVRFNTSPELSRFWTTTAVHGSNEDVLQRVFRHLVVFARHFPIPHGFVTPSLAAGCLAVGTYIAVALRHRDGHPSADWLIFVAIVPVAGIVASTFAGLYPNSARTSLVLVPAVALVIGVSAAGLGAYMSRAWPGRGLVASLYRTGVGVASVVMVAAGVANVWVPEVYEDYRGAVGYIGQRAAGDDIVFVHSCCDEGTRLYRRLEPWPVSPTLVVGTTGQACCRPDVEVVKHRPEDVKADVLRAVPAAFQGRVWVLYVDRPDYWRYSAHAAEGPVITEALTEAGCRAGNVVKFTQMAVSVSDCGGRSIGMSRPARPESLP